MAVLFGDQDTFEKILDRNIRTKTRDLIRIAADILGCEDIVRTLCVSMMDRVKAELTEAKFDFRPEGAAGNFVFEVYVKEKEERERVSAIVSGSELLQNDRIHYGHYVTVEFRVGYLT